jgi:hypothetical protein
VQAGRQRRRRPRAPDRPDLARQIVLRRVQARRQDLDRPVELGDAVLQAGDGMAVVGLGRDPGAEQFGILAERREALFQPADLGFLLGGKLAGLACDRVFALSGEF